MNIKIDRAKHLIVKNGVEYNLPKKEFELLNLLCENCGKVFSRNQIFEKIWTSQSDSKHRTVDTHIVSIRKKLGEDMIITLKGIGYKCNCK